MNTVPVMGLRLPKLQDNILVKNGWLEYCIDEYTCRSEEVGS